MIKNPLHPGNILKHDILYRLQLTIAELAAKLEYDTNKLDQVICEKAPITEDLAEKLAKRFKPPKELWLEIQRKWDLSNGEKGE